jgi:hypothetical protein
LPWLLGLVSAAAVSRATRLHARWVQRGCLTVHCAPDILVQWSPKDQPQLYLTPEVLAGLLAGFVCLCGVCIGVQCVMNIQSPRNFPKPEGQKL